jgi:predicted amidohydrolase
MSFLTITLIQSDLRWEDKEANLQMFSEKIGNITGKTEVVILPEMFSTGFSMKPEMLAEKMDGETIQWMKKISASKKIILTGSLIIEEEGKYFNRLVWMLPTGEYGYYDKRHLFAFAKEDQHFTAGSRKLIASVNGWKINLQVCYDLRFPVWTRQAPIPQENNAPALQDLQYDLAVFVASWPEKRINAWKTLLQARAIENQCYVVGVNRVGDDGNGIHYTGDSMIVDPLGTVLYQKTNEEDIFTFALDKEKLTEVREKLPFWKEADYFKL